jgi:hypothetical protein
VYLLLEVPAVAFGAAAALFLGLSADAARGHAQQVGGRTLVRLQVSPEGLTGVYEVHLDAPGTLRLWRHLGAGVAPQGEDRRALLRRLAREWSEQLHLSDGADLHVTLDRGSFEAQPGASDLTARVYLEAVADAHPAPPFAGGETSAGGEVYWQLLSAAFVGAVLGFGIASSLSSQSRAPTG